jgi:ParB family transcriptional regulator, chromosome partitioning protein
VSAKFAKLRLEAVSSLLGVLVMVDDSAAVPPARASRLGRGLAALIGDTADENSILRQTRGQRSVPIEFVRANPLNPRKVFAEEYLTELADSIREKGIIQPLIVRPKADMPDVFEIIAGERRWRAAQRAGLHEVPIVVIEVGDKEALELAIIENVQRADLNPLEEAAGYEQLMEQFGYVQADLAKVVGKSRSHVANTMRLTKLPDSIKRLVGEGHLSAGHARALLAVRDPDAVAKRAVSQGLTVRDLERIAQSEVDGAIPRSPRLRAEKDADTKALEKALMDVIGLDVSIDHKAGGGQMTIRYKSLDQLDALCRRLRN